MESSHIVKLLKSYPLILDYNLIKHMLPITFCFFSILKFSPMELRSVLLKYPRLMTHSIPKIQCVVRYLYDELKMDITQVKRVLYQAPQIISLSFENTLLAKVSFLRHTFRLTDNNDIRKLVVGLPTILLCSVENNLRPKTKYLLRAFG